MNVIGSYYSAAAARLLLSGCKCAITPSTMKLEEIGRPL
jgi:hypothetical protein